MADGLRASLALRRLELNRLEADWLNHADVRVRYPCEGVEDGTGIAELVDTLTTTVHQQLIGSTPESEVLWVVRLSQLDGEVEGAHEAYGQLLSALDEPAKPPADTTLEAWAEGQLERGFHVLGLLRYEANAIELVGCVTLVAADHDDLRDADREDGESQGVHLCDLVIDQPLRGQGYGTSFLRTIQAPLHTSHNTHTHTRARARARTRTHTCAHE